MSDPEAPAEQSAERLARAWTRTPEARVGALGRPPVSAAGTLPEPGQPLPSPEREFFERRVGEDLGGVRIHTSAAASEAAQALGARAFTVGWNVGFAPGEYQPGTSSGRMLLAHELAHVIRPQPGAIGRAISPDYERIKSNLSYGLFDWAITDADAHQVLTLLSALSPADLTDTVNQLESDGLVARLIENIPDADRVTYASLIESIHQRRSVASVAGHIESLMSYGLLDWVITDEEARLALEALLSLKSTPSRLRDLVMAIPAKQYERFFDNLSEADRSANLRFLQDLEMMRTTGMTLDEMAAAQKTDLEAKALAAGVTVGEFIRGEATARGYGGYAATWWPSLTAGEKAAWTARFSAVLSAVKAAAPEDVKRVIVAAESAGGGIFFLPQEVEELGPSTYAFRQGNKLGVGKRWVETAEADPANVFENIVHELGGHLEYGATASWDVMQRTLAALPPGERAIAGGGPRHLYSAYQYMETEIYAELRELPFRTPGSRGDEPADDVEKQLKNIKDAFAPAIAEAMVRGFRRRIQLDSRITDEARTLFDDKVEVVFGITF